MQHLSSLAKGLPAAALMPVLCLAGPAAESTPADSTRFRGSDGSGVSGAAESIPVEFGPETNVLWRTDLPSGHSSPCISGLRLFLTSYTSEKERLEVLCLNRGDGSIVWRRDVPAEQIETGHPSFNPASSTPATDGNVVCAYFGSCGLVAFDMEGNELWKFDMPTAKLFSGHATSPVIAGGMVLLYRATENDHFLLAVDVETGEESWRREFDTRALLRHSAASTPVVEGNQVIVQTIDGVLSVELETGETIWSVDAETTATSSPVMNGIHVLVGTWVQGGEPDLRPEHLPYAELVELRDANGDGRLVETEVRKVDLALSLRPEAADEPLAFASVPFRRIDANGDGALGPREYNGFLAFIRQRNERRLTDHGLLAIRTNGEGDVTATHVKYLERQAIPEVPSPVVGNGWVYLIKNGGILTCVDAESGDRVYRQRIGGTGTYYASPILVGDHLYVASGDGLLTVIDVSGDEPEVLAANDMGEEVFATPAVVGGVIYLRTAGRMYALAGGHALGVWSKETTGESEADGRAFTYTIIESSGDRDDLLQGIKVEVVPDMVEAGARLYSIWTPLEGFQDRPNRSTWGLGEARLGLMLAWPEEGIRDEQLDAALAALDGVEDVTTRTFDWGYLVDGLNVPTGEGFYTHRELHFPLQHVAEVERLSRETWRTFDPFWGTRTVGLFWERREADDDAHHLRITWYPSVERWLETRHIWREPHSAARFRERGELMLEGSERVGTATDRAVP